MSFHIRSDYYVCPNPLGLDPYNICEYDCAFCFVKSWERGWMKKKAAKGLQPIDHSKVEAKLKTAFKSSKESKDPVVLALRAGLPVTVGRKCEPFGPSESKLQSTKKCLKLLDDYDVPFIVETRAIKNVEKYLLSTDVKCGANISILFGNKKIHDQLEAGTPSYQSRWLLVERLKEAGLHVGMIAEPLIPSVNDQIEFYNDYAMKAAAAKVDHVNFGELRVQNAQDYSNRLAQVGIDLVTVMRRAQESWIEQGNIIFDVFMKQGVQISTPDWVNFHHRNQCRSCCGLDLFHDSHNFTYQHAINVINATTTCDWDDFVANNPFNEKMAERVRGFWNGNPKYYNLGDVRGIARIGTDPNGNAVYGYEELKKSLRSVFL